MAQENHIRILFGDFAPVKYASLIKKLTAEGVTCETATTSDGFVKRLSQENFDLCLVNLLIGGVGPYQLINEVKAKSKRRDIKIVVVTKQTQRENIERSLKAGAHDFLAEPLETEEVYNRIRYHLAPKVVVSEVEYARIPLDEETELFLRTLLKSIEELCRSHHQDAQTGFLNVLQDLAKITDSNRTSLVIVEPEANEGMVVASSDDPSFSNYPIELSQYPEVVHVVHTGNIVLVDDVNQNQLTDQIRQNVKSISIGSMMVFPVWHNGTAIGALTIRRPNARELPPMPVLTVLQSIANVLGTQAKSRLLLRKIYSDFKAQA